MNDGLEKRENELSLSMAIEKKMAMERVMKFADSAISLMERYNPDCWLKAYKNQPLIFKPGTSPILKDVALAFGEEMIVDMIGLHIGEFARNNYIKVPGGEGYSIRLSKMMYENMQRYNCAELLLFFEKLQRKELVDISHCLGYSEMYDAIRVYGKYLNDCINKMSQEEIEDEEKKREIWIYSNLVAHMPLNNYVGVIKYGLAYGKAREIVIDKIIDCAKQRNIDITDLSDDKKRKLCLYCWNNMIVENENKELFYQGQKL